MNISLILDFRCNAKFEPRAKAWLAPEEKLEQVKAFMTEFFGHFEFRDKPVLPPSEIQKIDWLAIFMKLVGLNHKPTREEAKATYRRLAIQLHPDRGGSHEKMSELNIAYHNVQGLLN